jgi:hypothetical protein
VQEIEKTKKELQDLQNNPAALEKFAREHYLMKKDGEDIYIIEDSSARRNKFPAKTFGSFPALVNNIPTLPRFKYTPYPLIISGYYCVYEKIQRRGSHLVPV